MTLSDTIDEFVRSQLRQGKRYVPARLQAAMALMERLRDHPSLNLADHKKPNSSGLISHETFGAAAHKRLNLEILNKTHGRRSCDVGEWGPLLLKLLEEDGFAGVSKKERIRRIELVQSRIGSVIRNIVEADPIEVHLKGRSAEAIIRDILMQAEVKGKSGEVAQYLVGAKLMLRLGKEIPVLAANKGDRKSHGDRSARTGDFEIENTTIEVALGSPDPKHLAQIETAVEDHDLQIWLLTRYDRTQAWHHELELTSVDMRRVVVSSVETFVGQNMSEMGGFSAKGISSKLQLLFELYNTRWIATVGTPGMRIMAK